MHIYDNGRNKKYLSLLGRTLLSFLFGCITRKERKKERKGKTDDTAQNYETPFIAQTFCKNLIYLTCIDSSQSVPVLIQGWLSKINRQQTIDECDGCLSPCERSEQGGSLNYHSRPIMSKMSIFLTTFTPSPNTTSPT